MFWRITNPDETIPIERRLRTKIIATIGSVERERFDLELNRHENLTYDEFFTLFVQIDHPDCLMIDIIRLNMGFYADDPKNRAVYKGVFEWLKKNKKGLAKDVAVLCDLAGPKIRLGKLEEYEIELVAGERFTLCLDEAITGNSNKASVLVRKEPLTKAVGLHRKRVLDILRSALKGAGRKGLEVSIGDGKVILRADIKSLDRDKGLLNCEVAIGGAIRGGQGVTFEKVDFELSAFDKNDRAALEYILKLDKNLNFVAFIGVSFARNAKSILAVRKFISRYYVKIHGCKPSDIESAAPDIIAKIETKDGCKNIGEILDVADGVMIARGDLALQIGREEVPEKQKEIIALCKKRGKTVITATQMLITMEKSPKPTRAEVNDVFNAILDGTDAVMLSEETASGLYPAHAIECITNVAAKAEAYFEKLYPRGSDGNARRFQELRRGSQGLLKETCDRIVGLGPKYKYRKPKNRYELNLLDKKLERSKEQSTTDLICEAGCHLAEEQDISSILVSSGSGRTARMMSRFRPSVEIVGIARNEICRRKLLMSYGVYPINVGLGPTTRKRWQHTDQIFPKAASLSSRELLVNEGDNVVFVGGNPLGQYGKVNVLQVKEIQRSA